MGSLMDWELCLLALVKLGGLEFLGDRIEARGGELEHSERGEAGKEGLVEKSTEGKVNI